MGIVGETVAQITTPYLYDSHNNNFTGAGIPFATYRNTLPGTKNTHRLTQQSTNSITNFYKIYNQSDNNNNDFNNPGTGEVWSGNLTINMLETAFEYDDRNGAAGSYTINNADYYTFIWEDVAAGQNAQAIVMETSSTPATVNTGQLGIDDGGVFKVATTTDQTVTITLNSSVMFSGETIHLGFSNDNFSSDVNYVSATCVGSNCTATITGYPNGSTVTYYAFSSTVTTATLSSNPNMYTINFSPYRSYTVETILPVQLASFDGQYMDNKIALTWQTLAEYNNAYFIIEKSRDSQNWKEIGKVEGYGTTGDPQFYSFLDEKSFEGLNYYRLKQVDLDGKFDYSKVISVKNPSSNLFFLYPNPTKGNLIVEWLQSIPVGSVLTIFNIQGQKVWEQKILSGLEPLIIDLTNLPKGSYNIQLSHIEQNIQSVQRFVKF